DISKGQQTVTFPNPGRQVFKDNLVVQLQATATSGMPVTYEITQFSACSAVQGNGVPIRSQGTCGVRASQAGSDNWLAATPVEVLIDVSSGRAQLQWDQSLPDRTFPPATSFDVTASVVHGEPVQFEAKGSCSVSEKSHSNTSTTATV